MEIQEVNTFNIINQNISDELNVVNQDSEYAKKKRTSKVSKLLLLSTSAIIAILGGASLLSVFMGVDEETPTEPRLVGINNTLFSVKNNEFDYFFSVKNEDKLTITMSVKEGTEVVKSLDCSSEQLYEGLFTLKNNTEYNLEFLAKNNGSYSKIIYTQTFQTK